MKSALQKFLSYTLISHTTQRLALPLNILFLLLVFIGFNTCKVRFGISYTITIIVQANVNTLGDCDLQEKVVNMTNVHEHNDVTVSIKVQQFRSRCAKSVYYIVVVLCVGAMAINVIVNQAECQ